MTKAHIRDLQRRALVDYSLRVTLKDFVLSTESLTAYNSLVHIVFPTWLGV